MTQKRVNKKKYLVTLNPVLVKQLQKSNKKVSTTINTLLEKYLIEDNNQKLSDYMISIERFWKGSPFGFGVQIPVLPLFILLKLVF